MTIEEVFKNRDIILAKKKSAIKRGDVVIGSISEERSHDTADKAAVVTTEEMNVGALKARLVINTTNLIDSHMDCHIPGLWKKSLKETKQLFLLQEHEMEFEKIIADSSVDSLSAAVETIPFKKLGFKYDGDTEALIFDVQIKQDVNEYMYDLYKRGRVSQHSVGMRYLKVFLCLNSNEAMYASEKQNWDKYYPMVANKDVADKCGWFWAVTEAAVIEGSAVVKGSNHATPTLEIEIDKDNAAAQDGTVEHKEPENATPRRKSIHLLT